jgi:transcriptional regulator with XRE-family HTH domain
MIMIKEAVHFGDRIKELRGKQGLSQEQLATAVKSTGATISEIESGKRHPRYRLIEAIADYFDVSVDYLMGRDTHARDLSPEMRELFERARAAHFVVELKDFFEWLAAKRDKLAQEKEKIPRQPDEELLALVPDLTEGEIKAILLKFKGDVVKRIARLTPEQTKAFNEEVAKILYYFELEAKVKRSGELTGPDR